MNQSVQTDLPSIKYNREIRGMSAILLPFDETGDVDWVSFKQHIRRTFDYGLTPAVNMDTGYANLIDDATRQNVLELTGEIADGRQFIGGSFVGDSADAAFNLDSYKFSIDQIVKQKGIPIIFQSFGLTSGGPEQIVDNYLELAKVCDQFYAFELGKMFAPFGEIYSLETFKQLMGITKCIGAKHSSLRRQDEWDRIRLRDEFRPDFQILTGNDLAIDMVMYGSDYLLGLSTFAPDLFSKRDQYWLEGDPNFYELNDLLQYLGFFAFRNPTTAYKHSAAQFLKIRNWITTSKTHPKSPTRPDSDKPILEQIVKLLSGYERDHG
ncbi:MAG: dihydrodipicolinate synthase family protein [Planctomycetota bacterium]